MIKFWWTFRLSIYMIWYGISDWRGSFAYASDEEWQDYREQGFSPIEALKEDATYG